MEPYIEMLMNGGQCTTYEIHDCDYPELDRRLRWEKKAEDYKTERYFDTADSILEKNGCSLQLTELMSGHALLSLRSKGNRVFYQYLDAFETSQSQLENVDAEIADELAERFGVSVEDLYFTSATSLKSSVMKIKNVWVILSTEIVYGSHQASLSGISLDPEETKACLNAVLRHFQIRKKSEKTRVMRFRSNQYCKLREGTPEQNEALYPCLLALGTGYETGCFDGFFPYLADECEKTSQWSYETVCGKENVIEYYREKGELNRNAQGKTKTWVVELVNNMSPYPMKEAGSGASLKLFYSEGKLCLYLEQYLENEVIKVIVDLNMDENNKVASVCLCMPELFQFRPYRPE